MPAKRRAASTDVVIRPARARDLPAAGAFGAALARAHHQWDPARFFIWDDMARGYAWWLARELKNKRAVIIVAARGPRVIGYAYGRLEPRDWNALREACGLAIDLYVDEDERQSGVGKRLALALVDTLQQRGAPFVILQVAAHNTHAQRFFLELGCRATMIEMAIDRRGQAATARVEQPAAKKTAKKIAKKTAKKTANKTANKTAKKTANKTAKKTATTRPSRRA